MKKFFCFIFAVLIFFCFCSCSLPNKISAETISVKNRDGTEITLSAEAMEEMLTVWNESKWDMGVTKTAWDYCFVIDGTSYIYYSSAYYTGSLGRCNDRESNRTLQLSDEQTEYVDALLENLFGVDIE